MGNFEQALAFGQQGEKTVSEWLQSRGHMVFPAYEKEGGECKGPQLFAKSGDLVLPDMLAFREGRSVWFEVKRKTCFTWHRNSQQWATGIDLHHYEQYIAVSKKTNLPVWIVFLHPTEIPDPCDLRNGCPPKSPVGMFGGELNYLWRNENHRSTRYGRKGMVYWAHDKLKLIAQVNP